MDELQYAWEKAGSMPAYMSTSGMRFIGTITRKDREYQFWRDLKGGYWYDSKPKGKEKPGWQQRAERESRRRYGTHY